MKQLILFAATLLVPRSEAAAQASRPATTAQTAHTILVTAFGATPDSRKDATAAFQRAISACKQFADPVFVIPNGRYDFYPDSAIKKDYFISNTSSETECPSKSKTIGLLFDHIRNLRVEGEGSLLVFHGKMTTIVIDHCDKLTLSNLSEDFARPTMSEFVITGSCDTAIDVKVHPDSWYRLDSGRLTWYGENWTAKDHFCIRVDTTHAFFYANDEYDQLLQSKITEPTRSTLHMQGAFDHSRFPVGSVFTVRDPLRDQVGAFIVNSKNVRWENINMHYMHGLGIVAQFSENISMNKVRIEPAAGNGRMIASFADGMHFSSCKGNITIDSCRFDGLHDDAINIHGTHLQIVGKRTTRQLVLQYMHAQSYGFNAYYPGDSIAFVHPHTLAIYQYAVVRSAVMISPRQLLVTLTRPIPAEARLTDVIENISWTPRVLIRNCYTAGTETRGFLLTTRRNTLVEHNTFNRLGMSAILVADDGLSWYESGQVHDLTIRHNLFKECGHNLLPANYTITIAPENDQPAQTAVHSNIRITGNHFFCYTPAVLTARSVDGLVFSGNNIEQLPWFQSNQHTPATGKTVKAVALTACHHVTINDNR